MDKLTLAHEYAKVRLTTSNHKTLDEIIDLSWYYAERMLAEEEKRRDKSRPDVIEKAGKVDNVDWVDDFIGVDWESSPSWAVAWTMDGGETLWWSYKPFLKNGFWFVDDSIIWKCAPAPSFNYQGDWKDSLRERP